MKLKRSNTAALKVDKVSHQRGKRNPPFTPFRKQKLEFFLHESQSTDKNYRFGSVGSSQWIDYYVEFLNAPRVDAKIVSVWLQKFLKLKAKHQLNSNALSDSTSVAERDGKNNGYPAKWYTALNKLNSKTTVSTLRRSRRNKGLFSGSSELQKATKQNNSGEKNYIHFEEAVKKFNIDQLFKIDSYSKNQIFRTLSKLEEPWMSECESNSRQTTNIISNYATANILLNTNAKLHLQPSIEEDSGFIDNSVQNGKNNSVTLPEETPQLLSNISSASQNNVLPTDYGFKAFSVWRKDVPEQNGMKLNSLQFQTPICEAVISEENENELQQMRSTSYESDVNPDVSFQPDHNFFPTFPNLSSNQTLPHTNNTVNDVEVQRKSKPLHKEINYDILEITKTVADIVVNQKNESGRIPNLCVRVDYGKKRTVTVKKDFIPGWDYNNLDREEESCADILTWLPQLLTFSPV